MARRLSSPVFQFQPFSDKQLKILTWWMQESPYSNYSGIIADGAIRSGKTLSMSLSFVIWAMESFNNQNFAMCGKTISSFRRNVLTLLKTILRGRGYTYKDRRADNLLIVRCGAVENFFYIFGGKDESSQDLIQGITLAGVFFDEVALMPESFVNQATGRCSVTGSKYWFNCNPDNPGHYFLKEWIELADDKKLLYLHFSMDDNLSLSDEIKQRYRAMYTGVFYTRFILGKWVAAAGAIYELLANNKEQYLIDELPDDLPFGVIGVDFGGNKSGHAFCFTGFARDFSRIVTLHDYYRDGIIDPDTLATDFVSFVEQCEGFGIKIVDIRADSAEQVLIAGLQKALINSKLYYEINNAIKGPIIDRIRLYNMLLAQDRWQIMEGCKSTLGAFSEAIYDDKKTDDVRLDDGTTKIDPIDAQEYSTEPFQEALLVWGYRNGFKMATKTGISPGTAVG